MTQFNRLIQYLLFQDNLDAQKQLEYIKYLQDWGVDDHKFPPNETDQVQPIDRGSAGLGATSKSTWAS